MKVLIADDSSLLRKSLRKLVAPLTGIDSIWESHSVESSVSRIEEENPEVVILDIQMPDGNALDVLKSITRKSPKPLTIILTNSANDDNKRRCFELGADYFFDKTKEFEEVIPVLKDFIGGEYE